MTDEIKKQIEAEAKNYSEGIHTNIFMAGACALDKIQNLDIKKAKNILDLIKQNCTLMSREQKLLAELARLEDLVNGMLNKSNVVSMAVRTSAIEPLNKYAAGIRDDIWALYDRQCETENALKEHQQFKRELDLK